MQNVEIALLKPFSHVFSLTVKKQNKLIARRSLLNEHKHLSDTLSKKQGWG